ncbi:MAG TPA: alpha/beta hydrolase [Burkholderiales bacterium]|jgi:pimeloyl-ACP methyl ester carboxylesterase
MHFIRSGRGAPTLLFVHGFACNHADWRAQLDFFSKANEVVACDLRGHGETPGRPQECSIAHYGGDVAALVNHLELNRCILVGHSMGTRVVLEANRLLSSHDGERVGGIVLIDGSRSGSGDPDAAEAAAHAAIEKVGYPAFAEHLFRQMFFTPSPEADAIVARALKQSSEFGPRLWPSMARWDAAVMDTALATVRTPLLAIQSTTRDAQMRRSPLKAGQSSPYLDLIRSSVPGARIAVVPDTGHFTQIEAADEVNRLIAGFLKN